MTRSSRYVTERHGRSKSYKSPHSRNFRRRIDKKMKRSARCQQRSDLAAGNYWKKTHDLDVHGHYYKNNEAHSLNGKSHADDCYDRYKQAHLRTLNLKKIKVLWDSFTFEQRFGVFEHMDKHSLPIAKQLCEKHCSLEDFEHFIVETLCSSPHRAKNNISLDVAIKRIHRRGNKHKFVSHRHHKQKYAY